MHICATADTESSPRCLRWMTQMSLYLASSLSGEGPTDTTNLNSHLELLPAKETFQSSFHNDTQSQKQCTINEAVEEIFNIDISKIFLNPAIRNTFKWFLFQNQLARKNRFFFLSFFLLLVTCLQSSDSAAFYILVVVLQKCQGFKVLATS